MRIDVAPAGLATGLAVQSDNGSVFVGAPFQKVCDELGISQRFTTPYTPQQNGIAERGNRTIKEIIGALLAEGGLLKQFWGEAFYYAMFLMKNRPYAPLGGEMPYHKHVWVARIDPPTFGPKALEAIFLGVGWPRGQKAYRVQVAGAANGSLVYWSRDVYFEKKTASRAAHEDDGDSGAVIERNYPRRDRRQAPSKAYPGGANVGAVTVADFGASVLSPPAEGVPVILATEIKHSLNGRPFPSTPANVDNALSSVWSRKWLSGMGEEWAGFQRQDTVGELVKPSDDMKVLNTRWHQSVCGNPNEPDPQVELKSRLVVQGVKTIPFLRDYGPSYTPLPKWDLVAIFLLLATRLKSGRAFHLHLRDKLDEIGHLAVSKEATLYIGRRKSDYILFLIYVDDGLVGGKKELVEDLMGDITNEFDIEFKGPVNGRTFLGREIEYDPATGRLVVRVTAQIVKALKTHNFEDLKPLHMPIQPDVKYEDHQGDPIRKDKYLAAVGSLIFIATTRPDVQFAVGIASRYSTNPGPEHWKLVTRIYAYLSATRDISLSLGKDRASGDGLIGYVNANHAGDLGSRRSTSGVAIFLDGSLISSSSKRQSTVAVSTDTPIRVYSDNKSAVDQLLSPTFAETRKTVDVKVKYVEREFIDLKWINGNDNFADILTKALPAKVARAHGLAMGLVDYPAGKTVSWGSR
ncbi:hypothetical protein JCM3770_003666 [Rhodotorula araucariae]